MCAVMAYPCILRPGANVCSTSSASVPWRISFLRALIPSYLGVRRTGPQTVSSRRCAAPPVKLDLGRSQAFFAMGDVDEDGHTGLITMTGSPDDMSPGTLSIWRGDG